ncbi:MAG: transporter substrate-binding domain-containing protein, partial [Acetobacteraceae bacterium]
MRSNTLRSILAAIAGAAVLMGAGSTSRAATPDGTLARIRARGVIRLAYRPDAAPFSYQGKAGEPAGFTLDLCRTVAAHIAQHLGIASLKIAYVPVDLADRFSTIERHQADLLCGATIATLAARKTVDFSISTFVDAAGLLVPAGGPTALSALAGHKIGVTDGSTAERELRDLLKTRKIGAEVVPLKNASDAASMLDNGQLSAYFADRVTLARLRRESKSPEKLTIANSFFSIDPY